MWKKISRNRTDHYISYMVSILSHISPPQSTVCFQSLFNWHVFYMSYTGCMAVPPCTPRNLWILGCLHWHVGFSGYEIQFITLSTLKVLPKGKKFFDIGLGSSFLDMIPKAQGTKAIMGLYQSKKHLLIERNNQQNEEAIYRVGENVCQSYIG